MGLNVSEEHVKNHGALPSYPIYAHDTVTWKYTNDINCNLNLLGCDKLEICGWLPVLQKNILFPSILKMRVT
jgi:hypothetical protein